MPTSEFLQIHELGSGPDQVFKFSRVGNTTLRPLLTDLRDYLATTPSKLDPVRFQPLLEKLPPVQTEVPDVAGEPPAGNLWQQVIWDLKSYEFLEQDDQRNTLGFFEQVLTAAVDSDAVHYRGEDHPRASEVKALANETLEVFQTVKETELERIKHRHQKDGGITSVVLGRIPTELKAAGTLMVGAILARCGGIGTPISTVTPTGEGNQPTVAWVASATPEATTPEATTPEATATKFNPTATPSGPEATPVYSGPYPSALSVESFTTGQSSLEDAPVSITGDPGVQNIISKHEKLAKAVGLQFDHMEVKYIPNLERWYIYPTDSAGSIVGWVQIADSSSLSGWRYGELPTWDSNFHPKTDTNPNGDIYRYDLPDLHDSRNHFEVSERNGFLLLVEVTPEGEPQYWNSVVQKTMVLVDGAKIVKPTAEPVGVYSEVYTYTDFETKDITFQDLPFIDYQTLSADDLSTSIRIEGDPMEKAIPVQKLVATFDPGYSEVNIDRTDPNFSSYKNKPDTQAYKPVRAFRTKVNDKDLPGAIVLVKNSDNSITKLKMLLSSDFAKPENAKYLNEQLKNGPATCWGFFATKTSVGTPYVIEMPVDHEGNKVTFSIPEFLATPAEMESIEKLMDQWQKTGVVPTELGKYFLGAFPFLW